jgi:predicted DNA-binding protein
MGSTKTTLYFPDDLRERLKVLAARRGRTMSELLAEGAELVLARDSADGDREELRRRAAAAREELRQGLYEGDAAADAADDLVYGHGRGRPREA